MVVMLSLIVWTVTIILLGLGLIGIFVPGLPGVLLVFLGILLYAITTGFANISILTVIFLGGLILLAAGADYAGSVMGAKYGGGGKITVAGTVIGAVGGVLMGGILGLVAGVFIGALGGALIEGKKMQTAGKAAVFSVLGLLGSTVVQFVLAVMVIVGFLLAVFF